MPRPSKGPRLALFEAKGRTTMWNIRDGQRTIGTGCVESERAEAEGKLTDYIDKHHPKLKPNVGVYLLLFKGKVVYIGSSLQMPTRVAGHRRNGRPFTQAVYIATTASQRRQIERTLIKAINPSQNRQHRAKANGNSVDAVAAQQRPP